MIPPVENSTLIPPPGLSLGEDADATPSLISAEGDLDLRVLRGRCEGSKAAKKVWKMVLVNCYLQTSRSNTNRDICCKFSIKLITHSFNGTRASPACTL